ncbi:MAG TPA: polysaccharide biosynthesis tyrosine autokinase, partial [Thiolinea sp.]|nr:polysaccharide biosynthesis tyrosine autokinase [Thiolinea sp.]
PSMLALRRQLDEVEAQLNQEIAQEVSTSAAMLKSTYLAARGDEEAIRTELERYKQELLQNRDKSIGYNTLSREAETNRQLYDGLLQRYKEVSVAGYAEPNTVSVVDPATIPWKTNSPGLGLNLLIGLGGGLVLGVLVAFLLDFLDDAIHDTVELDRSLGLPLLGNVPLSRSRLRPDQYALMSHDQPRTPIAEAFRALKTNLLFASRSRFPRVVAVTSAGPAEGKTTTAINLATSLAQQGKTVLLIDCDLRCPALHKRLRLDRHPGLINFLMAEIKLRQAIQNTGIPHIKVIQAGDQPVTHHEVFSREKIGLMLQILTGSTVFDHVILDCPPVMGFGDALILGNCADATLLTLQVEKTCRRPLADAYKRLVQAHANVAGV